LLRSERKEKEAVFTANTLSFSDEVGGGVKEGKRGERNNKRTRQAKGFNKRLSTRLILLARDNSTPLLIQPGGGRPQFSPHQ